MVVRRQHQQPPELALAGHDTSAATRKVAEAAGAEIVEEILVPVGTRDFSAILLKIQQIGPDVIAAAVVSADNASVSALT